MHPSRSKSLALAFVFCLLPNFGLKAQTTPTTTDVSTSLDAAHTFAASGDILNVTATGSITVSAGTAVTGHADGNNTITNSGLISSTNFFGIQLNSLNVVTNSGTISGASGGIQFAGAADGTMLTNNPNRPAYNASDTLLDAYYFNNKVTNNTGATISGTNTSTNYGIRFDGARGQVRNAGDITAAGTQTSADAGIGFDTDSGGQGFIQNSGNITAAAGNAIEADSDVNEITIHNTGTIESTGNTAIALQSLNLIVNSNAITGGSGTSSNGSGINLSGTALAATVTTNPDRPAYDATDAVRDAYYFNNKVINEVAGSGATATTGTITGNGTGHGILIEGARAQILNTGGTITAAGSGRGINFNTNSGQGFVYNTGSITGTSSNAIFASNDVDEITIHNTGTISTTSTTAGAIVLESSNFIFNTNAITGADSGIELLGPALAATGTRPAYNAADNLRDAYYSNNTIINETATTGTSPPIATITGGGLEGHGINIYGSRVQIRNTGDIIASSGGHGIRFVNSSGESFVYNTGTIENTATTSGGNAINANSTTTTSADEITIHNDGGTIGSTSSTAIVLNSLNVIVNSGDITGGTGTSANGSGINLSGTALQATVDAQATRPAYDASATLRDAYYFNNKVINEVVGSTTGTITSNGTGQGINIAGARAQILNMGGTITAAGSGRTINFADGSGQSFVYNTGSITSASGNAIYAHSNANGITIHNTGTISTTSASVSAIGLQASLNIIVNSNVITGGAGTGANGHAINLPGTALQATVDAQATRPAFDTTDTAVRDAYYFNNKVINDTGGTITGKGISHSIHIGGARAQILNTGGNIVAEGSGHGIRFNTGSGQGFVQNTGSITSASGNAIQAASGIDEITIHNTGTIESTSSHAIVLRSLNLIVNSGEITGGTDSHGINLAGGANPATINENPTAPAWDASETDRDAYYFNNIVINEVGGTITGKGTGGHGIHVASKRAQIFNYGTIVAEGDGHGIFFAAASGESIVVNTGTISSATGWGIYADDATDGSIVVINGGTITGGAGAIRLSVADDTLVIRTGSNITGNINFEGGTGDELIYAGVPASDRIAASALSNLETTSDSDSTSTLGAVTPEPTPTPDSGPDSTPDPNDGSGGGPSGGSGGGGGSGSAASLGNYATLFRLSDELILDLNAGIQDAIYEHKFSLNSEKDASENASEDTPWWTQGFGSFRAQDESDDNAKASHILGGVLLGYDSDLDIKGGDLGFFLGVALGSLSTDDDAELTTQNFFGGVNFQLTKDKFFYGVNLAIGFTSYDSERSVEESGETVKIEGNHKGFFLSPEFIVGMKTQVKVPSKAPKTGELSFWDRMKNQVNGMDIIPSFRARYLLAFLGEYAEEGTAADRISVAKRNTGTIESRAQVAFPLQLANQTWKLEPRLGLQYRFDLNKSDFDVENLATEASIDYEVEKESGFGIFGGLSVRYLKDNTAFKFNLDTIYGSESLVLRAQAGFGFQF